MYTLSKLDQVLVVEARVEIPQKKKPTKRAQTCTSQC